MKRIVLLLIAAVLLAGCSGGNEKKCLTGDIPGWCLGFGSEEIPLPETDDPLYVAGYHNGNEISGVIDLQRANAVWIDCGGDGVILIGVDCVGLSLPTVERIRSELGDFCRESGCAYVNVFSTHTHAGVDTLGLWGNIAVDGKNSGFTDNLVSACVSASVKAYENRRQGRLYRGTADAGDIFRDSRDPQVFSTAMDEIIFIPDEGNGIRLVSVGAHAEALRGDNTLLSRDWPGAMSDYIKDQTGEDVLFMPSCVGGLIMTKELVSPFDAVENMKVTGQTIGKAALEAGELTEIAPEFDFARTVINVPLDNTVFEYYTFLGILSYETLRDGRGDTGYSLKSEMSLMKLGDVYMLLVPGEMFPELFYGFGENENSGVNGRDADPAPIKETAKAYGIGNLFVVGLANDELGYIVPPSDWLVDEKAPYITEGHDKNGKGHYEETNSCGVKTAYVIAKAAERLFSVINH